MIDKKQITKEMTIREIMGRYPETFSVFVNYGLHCIGCPIAQSETIEQAAKVHNIDLEKFIRDLNNSIKKTSADF